MSFDIFSKAKLRKILGSYKPLNYSKFCFVSKSMLTPCVRQIYALYLYNKKQCQPRTTF